MLSEDGGGGGGEEVVDLGPLSAFLHSLFLFHFFKYIRTEHAKF